MPPPQGLPGLHDQEQQVDFQGNLSETNGGGMGLLHRLGVDMGGVDFWACGPPSSACGVVEHSCLVVGTTIDLSKAGAEAHLVAGSTLPHSPSTHFIRGGLLALYLAKLISPH